MPNNTQAAAVFPELVASGCYFGGLPGTLSTSTNTTPLVDDVVYASPGWAPKPCTITELGIRTSSSNASASGLIKLAIYAADGAGGTPGTLLGITEAITVADSATNTGYSVALNSPVEVPSGLFWVAFLQDSTTGVRMLAPSGAAPSLQYLGTASLTTALSGSAPVYGYTGVGTYAGGFSAAFGTATINSTPALSPVFSYKVS